MQKQTTQEKRRKVLRLDRETLKLLTEDELDAVAAGQGTPLKPTLMDGSCFGC